MRSARLDDLSVRFGLARDRREGCRDAPIEDDEGRRLVVLLGRDFDSLKTVGDAAANLRGGGFGFVAPIVPLKGRGNVSGNRALQSGLGPFRRHSQLPPPMPRSRSAEQHGRRFR